jgi:hypothetical protein
MSPTTIAPSNGRGRGKLFLSAAALIAVAAFVGLRDTSVAPGPVTQATAVSPGADLAPSDTHLASLQSAFAMSHVGALRDEADVEEKPTPKARAAAPRPPVAPRAVALAPVAQTPLPPVIPAPPQVTEPVQPESKPSSLFGFVPSLPSPGKLVERVSSISDSITSFVRWR